MQRMFGRLVAALVLVGVAASGSASVARAQGGQAGPHPAPKAAVAKDFVGTWEGMYTSDHAPSAPMKVVIEAGETASKIAVKSMTVAMQGGTMQELPTRGAVVADGEGSWVADMMGEACQVTSIIQEGALRGSFVCGHGQINFTLRKK